MLDLDMIVDPQFEVKFDGQIRTYDPWKTSAALEKIKSSGDVIAQANGIREALGFPPEKEGVKTLTTNQCFEVMAALFEFLKELPTIKKLVDLTQSFLGSTRA